MKNNSGGYMPYNEETYDFGTYSATMKRVNGIRNALAVADAVFIVICIIFTIISFSYSGFASLIYLFRGGLTAAIIVSGTMYRLNRKVLIGSVAVPVLITLVCFIIGIENIYSLFMHICMILSAVIFMYLGIVEQPLAEKPGYPYFNEQSYEMSKKKEYIPDHKTYETRGTSMDGISIDDIENASAYEFKKTTGKMDEI